MIETHNESSSPSLAWLATTAGIFVVIFSVVMICMNENKVASFGKYMQAAKKNCVEVEDIYNPSEENDFKLVHATGLCKCDQEDVYTVEDELTQIKATTSQNDILCLKRIVEVYKEYKTKDGESEYKWTEYMPTNDQNQE